MFQELLDNLTNVGVFTSSVQGMGQHSFHQQGDHLYHDDFHDRWCD